MFAALGFVAMFAVSFVNYKLYEKFHLWIILGVIALIISVYIFGVAVNGSTRWLSTKSGFGIQPSELAKIGLCIYMAAACTNHVKDMRTFKGLCKILAFPIITVGLIAIENLSTGIICVVIVVAIWFVATPRIAPALPFVAFAAVAGVVLLLMKGSYRLDRIDAWLNVDTSEDAYQTRQGLYAIGSGGWFGRGIGQSVQKQIIPEAQNDMIFSIICEEIGIVGGIMVIAVFLMLLWRMRFIAEGAPDRFGSLMVVGFIANIGFQAFVNMAVVTNLIPNTGVTLPFISYGGTSLLVTLTEMGMVLSVSRRIIAENDGYIEKVVRVTE